MKLEQQVTSRELSERLRDLGVKQESLFCHHNNGIVYTNPINKIAPKVSAFTVAELGEMLPVNTSITKGNKKWCCRWWIAGLDYLRINKASTGYLIEAYTEAEARGLMLVYLLENKLITP